jgi:hypothetical protein
MLPKPSRTARKKADEKRRRERVSHEQDNKAKVRRRDRGCRFPLCGCRTIKLQLIAGPEVSHQTHKAMGGNPSGDRSLASGMIQLCRHRHQDGIVSRHKGTMRVRELTPFGTDGPVAFDVRTDVLAALIGLYRDPLPVLGNRREEWTEIALEQHVNVLAPLLDWQREALTELARMEA